MKKICRSSMLIQWGLLRMTKISMIKTQTAKALLSLPQLLQLPPSLSSNFIPQQLSPRLPINKILLAAVLLRVWIVSQHILFESTMSESKLVDGKTGELIGNNYYSSTGANYVTTTSNYVPANASYSYGAVSGGQTGQTVTYTTQPTTTTYTQNVTYTQGGNAQNIGGASYYVSGGSVSGGYIQGGAVSGGVVPGQAQVIGTTVNTGKEVIKGESRIEYVPFEKKIVEYKDQAKVERVPKKVKKVEYREERKIETIPKEVTVTDYYAVEYLRQYIPQYVPEKRIEYVQVPKKQVRYEYIPVERQIVHYPDQPLEVEKTSAVVSGSQVQAVSGGQTTYVTGGQTTYVTGGQTQYVVGAPTTTTYVSGSQAGGYVTGGSRAGQTTYVTGGQSATYVTGGQTYTTTQPGNVTYTSGPVQTTYEYVNAPSSTTYVETTGQRWDPNTQYVSGYEYTSYPETYATQK